MRGLAVRVRNGAAGQRLFAWGKRARLATAVGAVTFDVSGRMGMGAVLTHLTLLLGLAERRGLAATLRCTNPLYARVLGRDWFPDFFERTDPPVAGGPHIRVRNDHEQEALGSPCGMSLAEGLAIFSRHLRFVPFLHAEADALFARELAGRTPLGVHYRGTDKHGEAPVVARARAIAAVMAVLDRSEHDALFLATDEPAFARELRTALPGLSIASYSRPELVVAEGEPIHFADADGYWKGVDALVNILALARCDAVVRTASYLSGWAKVLSPVQRVLMLNQPYSDVRFPDALIRSDL